MFRMLHYYSNVLRRFGLVMYDEKGGFHHGYHQPDTSLGKPFGLAQVTPSASQIMPYRQG